MVRIVWTELSVNDLEEVRDYIAQDSKRYSSITVTRIYERVLLLTGTPLLGRMVPEFNTKTIRELRQGHYRIIYRISDPEEVEILRIIHDARILKKKHLR